jgi:hypothetical protein
VAAAESERTRRRTDDELTSRRGERGRGIRRWYSKIKSHLTCGASLRRIWARREARPFPNTSPFASRRAARSVSLGIARTCVPLVRRRAKGARVLLPAPAERPAGRWRRERGAEAAGPLPDAGAGARDVSVREQRRSSGRGTDGDCPEPYAGCAARARVVRPLRRLLPMLRDRAQAVRPVPVLGCTMSGIASGRIGFSMKLSGLPRPPRARPARDRAVGHARAGLARPAAQ